MAVRILLYNIKLSSVAHVLRKKHDAAIHSTHRVTSSFDSRLYGTPFDVALYIVGRFRVMAFVSITRLYRRVVVDDEPHGSGELEGTDGWGWKARMRARADR